jgi:hypothetical protein
MSAKSEKVRTALFGKLNVSAVTSLAKGGVHWGIAPETVDTINFVTFSRVPVSRDFALGNNLVGERDQWMIKAIVDEDAVTNKEPSQHAEEILTAAETAIGGALTISGGEVHMARRVRDIPAYREDLNDRHIWHHGFILETYTA